MKKRKSKPKAPALVIPASEVKVIHGGLDGLLAFMKERHRKRMEQATNDDNRPS